MGLTDGDSEGFLVGAIEKPIGNGDGFFDLTGLLVAKRAVGEAERLLKGLFDDGKRVGLAVE